MGVRESMRDIATYKRQEQEEKQERQAKQKIKENTRELKEQAKIELFEYLKNHQSEFDIFNLSEEEKSIVIQKIIEELHKQKLFKAEYIKDRKKQEEDIQSFLWFNFGSILAKVKSNQPAFVRDKFYQIQTEEVKAYFRENPKRYKEEKEKDEERGRQQQAEIDRLTRDASVDYTLAKIDVIFSILSVIFWIGLFVFICWIFFNI